MVKFAVVVVVWQCETLAVVRIPLCCKIVCVMQVDVRNDCKNASRKMCFG